MSPSDLQQIVDALTPVIRREVRAAMQPPSAWPTKRPFARTNTLMPGPMQSVVYGRVPLPYPLFDELCLKMGTANDPDVAEKVVQWAQERLKTLPEGPVAGGADNYAWWRRQAAETLFPKASKAATVASANDAAAEKYFASLNGD